MKVNNVGRTVIKPALNQDMTTLYIYIILLWVHMAICLHQKL